MHAKIFDPFGRACLYVASTLWVALLVCEVGCDRPRSTPSLSPTRSDVAAVTRGPVEPSAPSAPLDTSTATDASVATEKSSPEDAASRPEPGLYELPVPGMGPALVSVPESKRPRQPLLVAVHGAGDGPEWECRAWRSYIGERGVILCPRGLSLGKASGGFYHPDHYVLERLVVASLQAVRSQLGAYLQDGPIVYAAYSQGATMGSLMIVPHGNEFSRLILVEGGHSEWNVPRGADFKKAGGERVLFACGTRPCARAAQRSAEWLTQAGLSARVETDLRSGHSYGGPLGDKLKELFDWVIEGDTRWKY